MGRALRSHLDLVKLSLATRVLHKQLDQKSSHDKHIKESVFCWWFSVSSIQEKVVAREGHTGKGPPHVLDWVIGWPSGASSCQSHTSSYNYHHVRPTGRSFETSPLFSPTTTLPWQTTSDSLPSLLCRLTRVSRPPDWYGYTSWTCENREGGNVTNFVISLVCLLFCLNVIVTS